MPLAGVLPASSMFTRVNDPRLPVTTYALTIARWNNGNSGNFPIYGYGATFAAVGPYGAIVPRIMPGRGEWETCSEQDSDSILINGITSISMIYVAFDGVSPTSSPVSQFKVGNSIYNVSPADWSWAEAAPGIGISAWILGAGNRPLQMEEKYNANQRNQTLTVTWDDM
jgi:hypothetical protein